MFFLRHPTPDVEPGTCYGQSDLDIAEIGHEQIERALTLTPPLRRIFASPALRCRKLALSLGERDGIEVSFDARLWEMHMGDWEGLKWTDIDRTESEKWLSDPIRNHTPNGECYGDVQARVMEAINAIGYDQETAIVCHAGPIRAVQMAWEGMTFAEAYSSSPPYAEPISIHPTGKSPS